MKKYILIISLLALTACTNQTAETTTLEETTVSEASLADITESTELQSLKFTTKTIKDEVTDESIFSNYDITMINVWATYCGPCIVEMPILEETYQELLDMNCNLIGLVADTALDTDDPYYVKNLETANQIVEDNGVTFESLQTELALYSYMSDDLRLNAVPTTFFVDKDGNRVGSLIIGVHTKEQYIQYVEAALSKIGK